MTRIVDFSTYGDLRIRDQMRIPTVRRLRTRPEENEEVNREPLRLQLDRNYSNLDRKNREYV